jgi:hypothetical protein
MKPIRLLSLVALSACSLSTTPDVPEGAVKVLFIGNSLTYQNDLPQTIAQLAASAGLPPCYCVSVAYANYALEDHWYGGHAVDALDGEDWDFVVMQQGPSALAESREHLRFWSGVFGEVIDTIGAQAVMYGVWPQRSRSFDFPNVTETYRLAASDIGALFAPAGEAWQLAWAQDPTLPLYAGDDFHPSTMGTYLAALVIFQRIYARSPVGVQVTAIVDGRAQSWPLAVVQLLQTTAAAANAAEDAIVTTPP